MHKKISNSAFQGVDTLRKISKFKFIEESFDTQKRQLHWHFLIYNLTSENPYHKIDAFVWSFIFREKIPRYDDRIYKMSHYLIEMYEKLKTLSFKDIENLNFDLTTNIIPYNFKEKILLYNKPLDQNTLFKEKYSGFNNKLYSYYYLNEKDLDKENLRKSFVRYTITQTIDKNNFFLRSKRKEDELYDELKDKVKIEELETKLNSPNRKVFNKLFEYWVNKIFGKIISDCETVIIT